MERLLRLLDRVNKATRPFGNLRVLLLSGDEGIDRT